MSDELKPCPCCDSENVGPLFVNKEATYQSVAACCRDCGLQTRMGKHFTKAREVWNTRPEDQECESCGGHGTPMGCGECGA